MAHTVWVQLEGPKSERATGPDNSTMVRLERELTELAKKLGIPPLSQFYDHTELQRNYDPEGAKSNPMPEVWSEPSAALPTVDALLAELKASFDSLGLVLKKSQSKWPDALIRELEECRAVLMEGVGRGRRFRFYIVP